MRKTFVMLVMVGLLLVACNTGREDAPRTPSAPAGLAQSTVAPAPGRDATTELAPTPTLAPTVTPTPTPIPTPTPNPVERITQGQTHLVHEDFAAAAREFQASLSRPGALTQAQQLEAMWGLAEAYRRAGRSSEAADMLNRFLALAAAVEAGTGAEGGPAGSGPAQLSERQAVAYFHLGQVHQAGGACDMAIPAYQTYLEANPAVAAYVQMRVAQCQLALDDTAAAIAAYEAAVSAGAHRLAEIEIRQTLADLYLAAENYEAAVTQYDAIRALAVTENTKGQMTYLAGQAKRLAGEDPAGFDYYLQGVADYPRADESYLGLLELIAAGVDVDPFRRGLVDYYAGAYDPAVAAFTTYLAVNPEEYDPEVHLFLAWSYEGLGDLEAALGQLDAYAATGATESSAPGAAAATEARAAFERANLRARAGQTDAAITAYLALVDAYPAAEQAPEAAWQAALLTQQSGDVVAAIDLYRQVAEAYPAYDDAPLALFRAGRLAWENGDGATATALWRRVAGGFPESEYGPAGLIWLMKTLPAADAESVAITATQTTGAGYYALRARELAAGEMPFTPPPAVDLTFDEAAGRTEADAWLRAWLGLQEGLAVGEIGPELAQDGRLVRGETLWRLGLYDEAKRELESLRADVATDALASYQLALYFRDLGLYRSSILAADAVVLLSGRTVFDVPSYLARLSYPVYYSDLILSLAEEYGYDPLLQFSLVRQESLYESFVASYAGAQGLSQVMPATGADIAQRLGWPEYETADLHRPYVGLRFGGYYLDQQLRAFAGDVYAALSAYNGGPGNAIRWHALAPDDPDLYLEIVDYAETRLYIRRIYTGYAVYRYLYGVEGASGE